MGDTGFFSTTIWSSVTSIFALLYAFYLFTQSDERLINLQQKPLFAFILCTISIIYIGTRPIWCYTDTMLYTMIFNLVKSGIWVQLPYGSTEPFWSLIEYICIDLTDASGWLLVIAFFYILGMSIAAYRWLPNHLLVVIMFIFTAFSFWSFATNTIRNGMATSIAMIGLSCFNRTRKELLIGFLLLILAVFTHKSCMLIIAASIIALFLKNTKINISIWLFCIVLGLIFQEQFKSIFSGIIDDDRFANYIKMEVSIEKFSHVGFRWDFILYSSLPIVIGWLVTSIHNIKDQTYQFILHTYIFANAFWILINTIAYSDRFAYLSWFLYPILIVYPFCKFRLFKYQGLVLGIILITNVILTYII